jgi:hypothetical protein
MIEDTVVQFQKPESATMHRRNCSANGRSGCLQPHRGIGGFSPEAGAPYALKAVHPI